MHGTVWLYINSHFTLNLKTGVVSHPREGEVVLTADYEALGSHYQTAIMPAGIRKPKQKASVEGTVGKIATAIIARLRNETFYSFEDLKAAVTKKLYGFNHESFQKREGSRYDAYLDEKPSCIHCRLSLMRSPRGSMAGR